MVPSDRRVRYTLHVTLNAAAAGALLSLFKLYKEQRNIRNYIRINEFVGRYDFVHTQLDFVQHITSL